jgi:hypothetical protein
MNPAASVDIDAPIEWVWAVMLDTEAYGEWNPFVVRAECPTPAKVGDPITLYVEWANGRSTTSPERITVIEPPAPDGDVRRATLAYVYEGLPSKLGLVRGTRYQRLSQAQGGPTRYETVEEFAGPLVALAGPKRVEDGFRRHAEALRARCESL